MTNLYNPKEDDKEDGPFEDEVETAANEDDLFGGFLQNNDSGGI
jgi:hypothetical protein